MSDPDHDFLMDRAAELRISSGMSDMDLGNIVYARYYGEAKKRGIVWTLYGLAERDGFMPEDPDDFVEDHVPDFKEHGQAIEHVLQMEISIFVFRRLNGPWGEVIDGMRGNRNRFCNEYREKTGYQIDTRQDDLIY